MGWGRAGDQRVERRLWFYPWGCPSLFFFSFSFLINCYNIPSLESAPEFWVLVTYLTYWLCVLFCSRVRTMSKCCLCSLTGILFLMCCVMRLVSAAVQGSESVHWRVIDLDLVLVLPCLGMVRQTVERVFIVAKILYGEGVDKVLLYGNGLVCREVGIGQGRRNMDWMLCQRSYDVQVTPISGLLYPISEDSFSPFRKRVSW